MLSLATHAVLHRFAGQESDWAEYGDQLTAAQVSQLTRPPPAGPPGQADPGLLQPWDGPLLAALGPGQGG